MPLLLRLSAVDYVEDAENAWTLDNSIQLVASLKNLGVDLVTASGGGFVWVDKSTTMEGYQAPFSAAIKPPRECQLAAWEE